MTIEFPAMIELEVDSEPKKFELDFSICETHDCDCNGVNIALYNQDKSIDFFLDFSTGSFHEKDYSEEDKKILKSFIDFLGKSPKINLPFFKKNYEYVKDGVRNRKEAIDSFELGTFLAYRNIIWDEDDMEINIDGKNYFIFDAYCVTPDCACKTVALNFFEDVHKSGVRKPDFSFVYDYNTGIYRDPVGLSDIKVENIIKTIPGSIKNKFKKRHLKLKKEVEKDISKKIEEKGFVSRETGKRKLGRNEPCHCGSGKKYKKCCLNKDIGKYGRAIKVDY